MSYLLKWPELGVDAGVVGLVGVAFSLTFLLKWWNFVEKIENKLTLFEKKFKLLEILNFFAMINVSFLVNYYQKDHATNANGKLVSNAKEKCTNLATWFHIRSPWARPIVELNNLLSLWMDPPSWFRHWRVSWLYLRAAPDMSSPWFSLAVRCIFGRIFAFVNFDGC